VLLSFGAGALCWGDVILTVTISNSRIFSRALACSVNRLE
jgi:hypothetical protein